MQEHKVPVSFVMPIYNVEKYLEASLKSALDQTLAHVEVVCVDDGSNDLSGDIIDAYAEKYPNITVIHKENSGYGDTMNVGIDHAKGEYIAILEPDDMIAPNMAADLYQIAKTHHLDFVKSDFAFLNGGLEQYHLVPAKIIGNGSLYDKVLSHDEKKQLFKGYIAHWTGIYNKQFLEKNHIRFNVTPGASFQDTGFWFQTLMLAKRVYLHSKYYYYYRVDNPNSSMKDMKKVFCICEEYKFIYEKLEKDPGLYEEYMPEFINSMYAGYRDTLNRIPDKNKKEFVLRMADEFGKLDRKYRTEQYFWNQSDYGNLIRILNNPEQYASELHLYSERLHDVLRKCEGFYIYGPGHIGQSVYHALLDKDRERMIGFIVTDRGKNARKLDGKIVFQIDEIRKHENDVILIGVSPQYQAEIVAALKEKGIGNYIIAEDLR